MPLPTVSILVAARNEESRILHCLQALASLTYPAGKLDICIGDDDSDDATHALAEAFIEGRPHFRLVKSSGNPGHLRGKANLLAQLARLSQSDFLLITDADVAVPPGWVESLLAAAVPGVGIVTGVTVPLAGNVWAALQAMEWAYVLFGLHLLARRGVPVTAMGNNMLVSREAYLATGGYENLPFSITEDYLLFREVLARGYGFRQVYAPDNVAVTHAAPAVLSWLHQRKRWMHGVMQSAWHVRMLALGPVALLVVLAALACWRPELAGWLWLCVMAVQIGVLGVAVRRLRLPLPRLLRHAWLFPFYTHLGAAAALLFYWLPQPTVWKGREYR